MKLARKEKVIMMNSEQITAAELKDLIENFFMGKEDDSFVSVDELCSYLNHGGKNWLAPISVEIGSCRADLSVAKDPFNRLLDVFIATRRLPDATKKQYRYQLEYFFDYLRDRGIVQPRETTINEYLDWLTGAGWKDTSIKTYLAPIKKFFKWTNAERIYPNIAADVVQKVDKGIKKKVLTEQEAFNILQGIDRSTRIGKRNHAIFFLTLMDGLRTIEVSRANVGDIQRVSGHDVLFVQGKGHHETDRYVKLIPEVSASLSEYLSYRKDAALEDPLFISEGNRNTKTNERRGRITAKSVSRIIKTEMVNAGVDDEKITPHSLRHTAATWALEEGQPIGDVQNFLRHENLNTVLEYVKSIDRINNECSAAVMDHLKKGLGDTN